MPYDGQLHARLRAGVLTLLAKTARELAARPVPSRATGGLALPRAALGLEQEAWPDATAEVTGRGFAGARRALNGAWTRCAFVHDAQERALRAVPARDLPRA